MAVALAALPEAADDIRAPSGQQGRGLQAADGLAALVTFRVAGPHASADSTVLLDLAAVRKIQAANPNLLVREAGSASTSRVANSLLSHDFRKSEWTSIPLTLILLICVFGALIAAGIPVLLAGTAVVTAVSLLEHRVPLAAGGLRHLGAGARHRDGGRGRLLTVLSAPGAGGTDATGTTDAEAVCDRRGDVRQARSWCPA